MMMRNKGEEQRMATEWQTWRSTWSPGSPEDHRTNEQEPHHRPSERPQHGGAAAPPSIAASQGVANCYVFKSRLQEYAQKVSIPTPVYQTIKEGPSHEPVFRSSVIVNNISYDSLPGFFNRKAAEQSAAEIALIELHKSGQMIETIPTVHETGLCKNLLQEYAQKMNYAIPSYICSKSSYGANPFNCTVEIGGIQYIGAAAKTKREAEIKTARTALLAIQSQSQRGIDTTPEYTVLPGKRKGKEQEVQAEAAKKLKPKKDKFKKNWLKRKFLRRKKELGVLSNADEGKIVKAEDTLSILNKDGERMETNMQLDVLHDGLVSFQLQQGLESCQNQQGLSLPTIEMNGYCQDVVQNV